MKRIMMCVVILWSLIVLIGNGEALAEWQEIPLSFEGDQELEFKGHAFATEMPGDIVYITGRLTIKNNTDKDRWFEKANMIVIDEGDHLETVLGDTLKLTPKIVEKQGGLSFMSFTGIVRGIPIEDAACRLEESSQLSPVICSLYDKVPVEYRENENNDLILKIELGKAPWYDCDVNWWIIDKSETLQWYEASTIEAGAKTAELKIPAELRKGYVDDINQIGDAFADVYLHIDLLN